MGELAFNQYNCVLKWQVLKGGLTASTQGSLSWKKSPMGHHLKHPPPPMCGGRCHVLAFASRLAAISAAALIHSSSNPKVLSHWDRTMDPTVLRVNSNKNKVSLAAVGDAVAQSLTN